MDKKKVYPTNLRNSMSQRYTYEHSFIERNKLEKYFSKIESYIGPAIKKIIRVIQEHENGNCHYIDICNLVHRYMREFIIFYYRSGALLHEFSFESKEKEDKILLLLKKLLNSQYIKELSKTIVSYYNFTIIKSEGSDFILSDQFVSTAALGIKNRFANASNRQMGFKNVIVIIPISSQHCAVYYNGQKPDYIEDNKINILSDDQVEEINSVIINNSYVKCIGYNEDALKKALFKFNFKSPSGFYAHFKSGAGMGAVLKKEVFFYEEDEISWDFFTSMRWRDYEQLGRNDKCLCKSGQKFKKCCLKYYQDSKRIMEKIISKENPLNYKVSPEATIEMSVDEFYDQPSNNRQGN